MYYCTFLCFMLHFFEPGKENQYIIIIASSQKAKSNMNDYI